MRLFNLPILDVIHRSFVIFLSGATLYGLAGMGYLMYKRREKLRIIEEKMRKGILPSTPVQTPPSYDERS